MNLNPKNAVFAFPLLFCIMLITIASCNKSKDDVRDKWVVQGRVMADSTGIALPGSTVTLEQVRSGWFASNSVYSGIADENGYYRVAMDKDIEIYRARISVTTGNVKYPSYNTDIYIDTFINNPTLIWNVPVPHAPIYATLRIEYHNANPVNDSDMFHLTTKPLGEYMNEVYGTVKPDNQGYFIGKDVHGLLSTKVKGNENVYIRWSLRKGGVARIYSENVLCPGDKTTTYVINY